MVCPNCKKEVKNNTVFCHSCSTKLNPSDFDHACKMGKSMSLQFCIERADLLVKERKFNDALEYFSKAIELDPNNADIYNEKGKCYSLILCSLRLGYKYKEALENFLIAYELNPKNIQTIINIGDAKMGLKEFKEAIEIFSEVLKKDKFNIEALTNRAFAKMVTRDYLGVKKDTAKVLKIQPDNAYCLYIYGTSLIEQGKLAEGVHYLQRSANLSFDLAINSINRLAPTVRLN